MADLIIIRIHPVKPVDAATFTSSLKGLIITVFDRSYGDRKTDTYGNLTTGTQIGTASFDAPDLNKGAIVQHVTTQFIGPFPVDVWGAAATAAILIDRPAQDSTEYQTADLRLEITQNNTSIADSSIDYNVSQGQIASLPSVPNPLDQPPVAMAKARAYMALAPASLYWALPLVTDSNYFSVPTDGTPPNFDGLLQAVEKVLASDPAAPVDLTALTVEQCRHIAYEIAWNRKLFPLPAPTGGDENLAGLYTTPYSGDKDVTNNRQQFESDLTSYYATNNGQADVLTKYVYALSASGACQDRSEKATQVDFTFPILLGGSQAPGQIAAASVGLSGTALGFGVPAQYFYALSATLPPDVGIDLRFRMATVTNEKQIVTTLQSAINAGVITVPSGGLAISLEQAARRLHALGSTGGVSPVCAPGIAAILVGHWLAYQSNDTGDPEADLAGFWAGTPTPLSAQDKADHRDLVICAITQLTHPNLPPDDLVTAVGNAGIPIASTDELKAITADQWTTLFTNNPLLLVDVTGIGSGPQRASRFVRRLTHFFTITPSTAPIPGASVSGPPQLDKSINDPITAFLGAFTPGFTFGQTTPLDPTLPTFTAAVTQVFPTDTAGQAWLTQVLLEIDTLYFVSKVGTDDATHFSIAEALYARGFTDKASITALSSQDFADALIGTIAHPHANQIQARAGGSTAQSVGTGTFGPINPGGTLTNCLPPPQLSPFGSIAYLYGLLNVSTADTCDTPQATALRNTSPVPTLGSLISARRGPIGTLSVTRANMDTPLPVIDLVNECLEAMVATPSSRGVVYNTAPDRLGDHLLRRPGDPPDERHHDPVTLFGALPQHSSPATPVDQPNAYTVLAQDFSACCLPYVQSLDVNRSYLHALHTTRFSTMRHFRKDISEFVLDPANEPATFPKYRWRYPVRIDTAREYLRISPAEYDTLYTTDLTPSQVQGLYGFSDQQDWVEIVVVVSEFLERTCLTYCEFLDLWKSGFVTFERVSVDERESINFPECPPCYLNKERIDFGDQDPVDALKRLGVFIPLWRTLQDVPHAHYSFATLRDICDVLQLFQTGGAINPDFIRQLAGFQMLRDDFHPELTDPGDATSGIDAERTHLLALWVGPTARKWAWARGRLLSHLEHDARRGHGHSRGPEFHKLLIDNLTPLSVLAGFDPATPANTWWAAPTHTLRFAEVLGKVYTSSFGVGELLYLFTADEHLDGDDPFPLPDHTESVDVPLDCPDEEDKFSLWKLRHKLLHLQVSDEEVEEWTWPRIETVVREDFGLISPEGGPDLLQALGEHFFPHHLERHGHTIGINKRHYRVPLATTTPAMWNTPPEGPFRFDSGTCELVTEIPLHDEAVLTKLSQIRALSADEQQAVRDLYFSPRLDLARLAFLFTNFDEAQERLIHEPDERERWHFFRHQVALCYHRSRTIADHLAAHVDNATGTDTEHGSHLAWRLLRALLADENKATTPWEDDAGKRPATGWAPPPSGGAFAALLGLVGTGLQGEFRLDDDQNIVWRELRGPTDAFGRVRNEWNAPVPTVIPPLSMELTPDQLRYAGVRNGIALANSNAERLGGVQGFTVTWRGALLIDQPGTYRFWGGAPTPEHEHPDTEHVHNRRWCVTLQRSQRSWVLLRHNWPDHDVTTVCSAPLSLKHGAYDLTIEFMQCPPPPDDLEDARPQHTGFQLKYEGPDTHEELQCVPFDRLFITHKDAPLSEGIAQTTSGTARKYFNTRYVSSLRDIRRTYQRAFKALLFARRFDLSAHPAHHYAQSELGYILDHPDYFAGVSFYQHAGTWTAHLADFDVNFLPLLDNYHPPAAADDDRISPSARRTQALFDIWERTFDYVTLRRKPRKAPERPVWLMFDEAAENQPDNPAQLLRRVDIDLSHAPIVLKYYRRYDVTAADLMDERWTIRVWHADEWIERIIARFTFHDVNNARPDLWASDDPNVTETNESESGNQNLTRVVQDGLIENGPPRRYEDLQRINEGLRKRARHALVAYLCRLNRVPLPDGGHATAPQQLSELLLLDVEVGLCERASRIEEAITAVQTFVQRARLGLEPSFAPTAEFVLYWERRFTTFRVWEACVRRTRYRENWIEWDELDKARRTEAFRFLESELRRASLTAPVPGGLEYWDGTRPLEHPKLSLLQSREPAALKQITPPQPPAADEALNLLATPSRSSRRSWLAPVSPSTVAVVDARTGTGESQPPGGAVAPPTQSGLDDGPGGSGGALTASVVGRLATAGANGSGPLPLWLEAAIRLGTRFVRVAAAGVPPAACPFTPRTHREGCCRHCGREHEPTVDEFYFWLIDSRWYDKLEGDTPNDPDSQDADAPGWHEAARLPTLLAMPSKPMVHLMWARIHNGEIEAPRRSADGVRLLEGTAPSDAQLDFAGRSLDSLRFEVTSGVAPPGYNPPPKPGFRYDLATDAAIVLPLVATPPTPPTPPWGGLPAYPYFAYVHPGAPLFPLTPFSEATSVASVLRAHCRFEAALRWYALAFDPLRNDASWCPHASQERAPVTPGSTPPQVSIPTESPLAVLARRDVLCCSDTAVPDDVARDRAITLDYVETLLDWGECLLLRNSPEAFQHARLIFDTAAKILGPTPHLVENQQTPTQSLTVNQFAPVHAPLNPRLLSIYERVDDRLGLIHTCNNAHRPHTGRTELDIPYFGDDPARDGWRTVAHICDDDSDCCCPPSPCRFTAMIEKARQLAAETRELGAALLGAFEKGDAEYLAYVRAEQEKQLLQLTLDIKQNQLREADWQVQALQKTKEITHTNLTYVQGLINAGHIVGETDYEDLTEGAIGGRTVGTVLDAICEVMNYLPDGHFGTVDFVDPPLGTKLSRAFEGGARLANETAEILSTTAGLELTQAGWDRREIEWRHQVDDYTIELDQIERQILAAERRRAAALRELNNHRRQIENSREVLDLLRDKFTNHQLYLFLQQETAALHHQTYELALCCARQAQRAFNYERGHTTQRFVAVDAWDNLREGLLAGERLQLAVRRMDKAYYDQNIREYELTKHISLRLFFAHAFLALKLTGHCVIELPEWLFDLDYPGHYLRRIKNVSLTIPCVVGPYTGVHCQLTLLATHTRIAPRLHSPLNPCCQAEPTPPQPAPRCSCWPAPHPAPHTRSPDATTNGYLPLPHDARIVRHYAATEAIATSSGQNDTGMFELNFRDERYLPFEFRGAISRWRLELPPQNNYFDMDTLSDVILHLNYTARDGGEPLREAANHVAQAHLPDDGRRLFDLRHEMPDEWNQLTSGHGRQRFALRLVKDRFPFVPGDREVFISRLELFIQAPDTGASTHREVQFTVAHQHGCAEVDEHEFMCVASATPPGFFHGAVDVSLGPLRSDGERHVGTFEFEQDLQHPSRAFLVVHYNLRAEHHERR
jgi:hypothetical protein